MYSRVSFNKANVKFEPQPWSDYDITSKNGCHYFHLPTENSHVFKCVSGWLYQNDMFESKEIINKLSSIEIFESYSFALGRDVADFE